MEKVLRRACWPSSVDEILLALHEALVNAQRHGGGALRAEVAIDDSAVVVTVWDCGRGFDPMPYVRRPPGLMAERGRGVWLMSRLATTWEVRCSTDGTAVVMRFERP